MGTPHLQALLPIASSLEAYSTSGKSAGDQRWLYKEAAVRLLAAVSVLHMLLLMYYVAICSFFTTRESYKNQIAMYRWANMVTSCGLQNAASCLLPLVVPIHMY